MAISPQAAQLLVRLGGWAAVLSLGAFLWHITPVIGSGAAYARLEANRDAWSASSVAWEGHAKGWQASFERAEQFRKSERSQAQAAVNSALEQCNARVAQARASARVIERIVTKEPTYDENRCPRRELVDPGSLRDALSARPGAD